MASEGSKQKNWVQWLLLLLVIVNLVAIGGIAKFMKQLSQEVVGLEGRVEEVAARAEEKASPAGEVFQQADVGTLLPMEPFLVNLSGPGGNRFLQAKIEVELDGAEAENEFTRKKPAIRDAVIVMLSSQTYGNLRKPAGLKSLRGEIRDAMNRLLANGRVQEVYFTQFHFN